MAVILYKGANQTVSTIADRNDIPYKIDGMVVTVLDAIADVSAGAGVATYRWVDNDQVWILITKSGVDTASFDTEELTIVDGEVTPSNVPIDNIIWSIAVVNGDIIMGEPRLEDLTVTPSGISGINPSFNGYKLRFTYAYGTVTQQLDSYVDYKVDTLSSSLVGQSGTVAEFEAEL